MTRKSKQLRGIISLALALVLLTCTMATTAFAADFSDVAQGAWYHEAVDFVSDEGLMAGVGGGRFEPNTSMTRGMLVTVLHRLEGAPAPTANNSFSDVAGGAYYAQAVTWAAENGIVAGRSALGGWKRYCQWKRKQSDACWQRHPRTGRSYADALCSEHCPLPAGNSRRT